MDGLAGRAHEDQTGDAGLGEVDAVVDLGFDIDGRLEGACFGGGFEEGWDRDKDAIWGSCWGHGDELGLRISWSDVGCLLNGSVRDTTR